MRILLGHIVDMLCLRRELLAILCHAYVLVGHGGAEVRKLPVPVVAELELTRDTLVLVFSDLGREPLDHILQRCVWLRLCPSQVADIDVGLLGGRRLPRTVAFQTEAGGG